MTTTGAAASAPWALAEVRSLARSSILGVGMFAVAWWGASGTARPDRQIAWLVVAILGIVVLGVGSFFWLLAARRALGQRRAAVMVALAARLAAVGPGSPARPESPLVSVPGSVRFHRADCQLVIGKATRAATLVTHGRARRRPCEMCLPDAAEVDG